MRDKYILVNYIGRKGAGAVFAYEMTRGLLQNGVKTAAIISENIENLEDWKCLGLDRLVVIPTYSNKISFIKNTFLFSFRQKKQIQKAFKNIKIDAIYCPMICPWTKQINKIFKNIPSYDTVHDPIPHSGEKWYIRLTWYKPTKNTAAIIVLSKKHIDYAEKKWDRPVIWIPHGRFSYYKEKFFKGYKSSDTINFLFFGRLEKYKGLSVLAAAFKQVQNKMVEYTLTIAGPGNWNAYAADFKDVQKVKIINEWIGPEKINELYSLQNIVTVLPYLDASQSGVIPVAKEYLSPIIASNTGGMGEQIIDGKTGILIPPGDFEALSRVLVNVYTNFEQAKKLAQAAYAELDELNWDKLAKKLLENLT